MAGTTVVGVITNPHSRKNRGQTRRAESLQRLLGGRGLVRETRSTDEIGPVLDEFRDKGVAYWVADGGDGCLHWMVNSAAARYGLGEVSTALPCTVPANGGTIDFVARHAGVRGRAEQIVRRLVAEHEAGRPLQVTTVPTLVMRGEQVGPDGAERPFERIGFAAAVAGAGSGFFDQYYASGAQGSKAIVSVISRSAASLVLGAGPWRRLVPERWLRYGLVTLGRARARVTVDGRTLPFEDLTVFNVGAFPINLGGVVKVFQHAAPGRIHAMVGDLSPFGVMAKLPRVFLGRPIGRGVFEESAVEVRAEALGEGLLRPVMDGELIDRVRWLTLGPGPVIRVPQIDARREAV